MNHIGDGTEDHQRCTLVTYRGRRGKSRAGATQCELSEAEAGQECQSRAAWPGPWRTPERSTSEVWSKTGGNGEPRPYDLGYDDPGVVPQRDSGIDSPGQPAYAALAWERRSAGLDTDFDSYSRNYGNVEDVRLEYTNDGLLEYLKDFGVVFVQRQVSHRRQDDGTVKERPSKTVVLTFRTDRFMPQRVNFAFTSHPVEEHFGHAVECFNCQRHGHIARNCIARRDRAARENNFAAVYLRDSERERCAMEVRGKFADLTLDLMVTVYRSGASNRAPYNSDGFPSLTPQEQQQAEQRKPKPTYSQALDSKAMSMDSVSHLGTPSGCSSRLATELAQLRESSCRILQKIQRLELEYENQFRQEQETRRAQAKATAEADRKRKQEAEQRLRVEQQKTDEARRRSQRCPVTYKQVLEKRKKKSKSQPPKINQQTVKPLWPHHNKIDNNTRR
ncbi:hypothetical protein HPB47_005463 [Ixodes persulcatus]|uniref:Uncharacterized protein n=1 Tax=Ixodes persulcatus TaxID=34615 RepID=A0AC60PCX2_IXOPE|nr:hypothetical protein HPB47_005463 [Ixodes persulcatus]